MSATLMQRMVLGMRLYLAKVVESRVTLLVRNMASCPKFHLGNKSSAAHND